MEAKNKNTHTLRNLFARAVAIMDLTVEEGTDSKLNSEFSSTLKEIEKNWEIYYEESRKLKTSG